MALRSPPNSPFQSIDAVTGEPFGPAWPSHGAEDVALACAAAETAFDIYRETEPAVRADLLERIGAEILALGDGLIDVAIRETSLPRPRLESERGRTIGQLRLFADVVRRGDWMGLRIDQALPNRQPFPRPDLRLRMIPLGPVAVFGASNFPLAFSTAGGDTASALAAGCPVVLKGHPAHPGTDAAVAGAIQAAVEACGLPAGVFSHLMGPSNELGAALVCDPRIAAVGFTGSRRGGLMLLELAQAREVPIPVYAEMSSINPVLLLPEALKARGEALGSAFVASLTLGAGQFCTKPGLVLAIMGEGLGAFIAAAIEALSASAPATLLTRGISEAYERGVAALAHHPATDQLVGGLGANGPALFSCAASDFIAAPTLHEEVFGPAALVVHARDAAELETVLRAVEGQLTTTIHMDPDDEPFARTLLPLLERKAGRTLANGWPTGVEVTDAMVHGGPYPATSDSRTTSVGSLAINRFLRPVAYQNLPPGLLPPALRDDGPARMPRLVNGTRQ
jgi:2,5-dioxopentanoate dehydrogenase